jgi:hypothetical protein
MPKKRVGVTLRKPSPAPESAAGSSSAPLPASSVSASSAVPSSGAASHPVMNPALSGQALAGHAIAGNTALAEDSMLDVAVVPAPPEPKRVEAFVQGAAAALEQAASAIPTAKLRELLQRGIEGYRELVLYLPEKLAQELSLHCLQHNLDMNRLVASLVEQHLTGVSAAQQRRAEDPTASASSLRATARGLLLELAQWMRAVLASQRRPLSSSSDAAQAS